MCRTDLVIEHNFSLFLLIWVCSLKLIYSLTSTLVPGLFSLLWYGGILLIHKVITHFLCQENKWALENETPDVIVKGNIREYKKKGGGGHYIWIHVPTCVGIYMGTCHLDSYKSMDRKKCFYGVIHLTLCYISKTGQTKCILNVPVLSNECQGSLDNIFCMWMAATVFKEVITSI